MAKEGLLGEMAKQTAAALAEADAIIFLADARDGVTPQDRRIAGELRTARARVWLVANKAEGLDRGTSRPRSSTSSGWASRTRSPPRMARVSRR